MSGLVFTVGTCIGERLLYLPSVPFVYWVARRAPRPLVWGAWAAWALRCDRRAQDWATSESLILSDGISQPRSTQTQFQLGNYYLRRHRLDEALAAYERSVHAEPLEPPKRAMPAGGTSLPGRGMWPRSCLCPK